MHSACHHLVGLMLIYFMVPGAPSVRVKSSEHEADHFHLVLQWRMFGSVSPLPYTPLQCNV